MNNFLVTCNLIAGGMALILLTLIAPGALSGGGGAFAVLALLCPLLAAVCRWALPSSSSLRAQPVLLLGTTCFSIVAVGYVLQPMLKLVSGLD